MERGQELKEDGGPQVALDPEGDMEHGQELREDGGPFLSPGSSHLPQEDLDEPPSSMSLASCRVSTPGPWWGGSVRGSKRGGGVCTVWDVCERGVRVVWQVCDVG